MCHRDGRAERRMALCFSVLAASRDAWQATSLGKHQKCGWEVHLNHLIAWHVGWVTEPSYASVSFLHNEVNEPCPACFMGWCSGEAIGVGRWLFLTTPPPSPCQEGIPGFLSLLEVRDWNQLPAILRTGARDEGFENISYQLWIASKVAHTDILSLVLAPKSKRAKEKGRLPGPNLLWVCHTINTDSIIY